MNNPHTFFIVAIAAIAVCAAVWLSARAIDRQLANGRTTTALWLVLVTIACLAALIVGASSARADEVVIVQPTHITRYYGCRPLPVYLVGNDGAMVARCPYQPTIEPNPAPYPEPLNSIRWIVSVAVEGTKGMFSAENCSVPVLVNAPGVFVTTIECPSDPTRK